MYGHTEPKVEAKSESTFSGSRLDSLYGSKSVLESGCQKQDPYIFDKVKKKRFKFACESRDRLF